MAGIGDELRYLKKELALKDQQVVELGKQSEDYKGKLNIYRNIIAEKQAKE